MEIHYLKPSELNPAPYNPRSLSRHDHDQLKKSLEQYGFVDPIIVNRHADRMNVVVGGHQRLSIAKELGIESVPCVFVELDEDRERQLNLRLNRNHGQWDFDMLANNFDTDFLMDVGFTKSELSLPAINPEFDPSADTVPETPDLPVSRLGDIYELGDHRLICGDSGSISDVRDLMDGVEADLLVTSPPYWNQREYSQWESFEAYISDMAAIVMAAPLSANGLIFWNIGDDSANKKHISAHHSIMIENCGFDYKDVICWYKQGVTGIRLSHQKTHRKYYPGFQFELCLVFTKPNADFPTFDVDFAQDIPVGNVWEISCETTLSKLHTAPFPVALPETAIKCYTSVDRPVVYEPFMGSGTTMIACERTKRKCYGIERDPKYCDVIIKRWEQFTGKKAKLVRRNGEDSISS